MEQDFVGTKGEECDSKCASRELREPLDPGPDPIRPDSRCARVPKRWLMRWIGDADENRLDVEDRRAIDGFDRADPQPGSRDFAHGHVM